MKHIENLEGRRLLAVCLVGNTLNITGNDDPNSIAVNQVSPTQFDVYVDGATTTISGTARVCAIKVVGAGGDDCIMLMPTVTVPTSILGGDGNDSMVGGSGRDRFDGGGGIDEVNYSARTLQQPLRLSANGVADDGVLGERDNIMPDVEDITGGQGADLIIGTLLTGATLDAQGGADAVFGGPYADLLLGGEGNDSMHGGAGNDYLAGGLGQDQLFGDEGDDVFEANDGYRDIIVGGAGSDVLYADAIDNWSADVETVWFVG